MNALQKSQRILLGLAIGVLLALLIVPETSWLARDQVGGILFLRPMTFGIGLKDEPPPMSTYKAIAQAHPNDFPIQLSYAEMTAPPPRVTVVNHMSTDDTEVDALHQLTGRFSDNPSLYANIMRISTRGLVHMGDRPEEYLILSQTPPQPPPSYTGRHSTDTVLDRFDQDAAAGERLDPNNAYFPFMRAYGLFAANKDDEAIAAILRAGQKTEWKEYYLDQVTGEWEMNEAVVGGKDSLARLAIAAAILFPHYAGLREAARIATYKAMLLEQSGNVDQGLAIRFALMHCGSLMRVQSTSVIGSLVGIAITRTAMVRPGGAPHIEPVPHEAVDDIQQKEVDAFYTYLMQNDRTREAMWVRAESAAGDQAKAVIRQGTTTDMFVMAPVRAGVWWGVDMLVLSCASWLLILGVAASLFSRTAQIHSGEPLPLPVRWGIANAFVLLGLCAVVALAVSNPASDTVLFVSLAVLTIIILVAGLLISKQLARVIFSARQNLQTALKAFGITLAAFGLMAIVAYWQIHWLVDISSILSVLNNTTNGSGVVETGIIVEVAVISVLLLLPAGVMAIVSFVRKTPLSVTLSRGYRNFGIPLACLLLIGYGVCVLFTTSTEREGNNVLEQVAHHEGVYYAQMAGQQWPGPVSEPDPALTAR